MTFNYAPVELLQDGPSGVASHNEHEKGLKSPRETHLQHSISRRAPRPRFNVRGLVGLPMALHLCVLALYVALCIIWALRVEQRWTIETEYIKMFQNINIINHVIMLGLTVPIVAVMQVVATHSAFNNLPQPLTVLADKTVAWNGLGSSLANLYENMVYSIALGDVLLITAYFATLSGLGLSSSYIFTIPAVENTWNHTRTAWPGIISLDVIIPPTITDTPSNFSDIRFDWYQSSLALESGFYIDEAMLAGMDPSRNRVFDTLNSVLPSNRSGSALVNYTEFHVTCGSVPQASLSAVGLSNVTSSGDNLRLPTRLTINYTIGSQSMSFSDSMFVPLNDTVGAIDWLWQPSVTLLRIPSSPLIPGVGRNLVLYNIYNETGLVSGSQPILDSDGSTGSPWPLTVQLPDGSPPFITGLRVQVIGCSLSTTAGKALLDATTNWLFEEETSEPENATYTANSSWTNWQPDLTSSTAPEDMWASMFLPENSAPLWRDQPIPPDTEQWSCIDYAPTGEDGTISLQDLQGVYSSCHVPTIIEQYLTSAVFFNNDTVGGILLENLEFALAGATGLTMWAAASDDDTLTTYTTKEPFSNRLVSTAPGNVTVTESRLVGRVDFNEPLLFLGTALAVILTVLGGYILSMTDTVGDRAPVDDVKLLSLMTIDNSAVASRLTGVETGSTKKLRQAGKFLVKVVDHQLVPAGETNYESEAIQLGLRPHFKDEMEAEAEP